MKIVLVSGMDYLFFYVAENVYFSGCFLFFDFYSVFHVYCLFVMMQYWSTLTEWIIVLMIYD